MMDQRSLWRTEGIVQESVKIGLNISDLDNTIMAKQMQWQAMYPKQSLKAKHMWGKCVIQYISIAKR